MIWGKRQIDTLQRGIQTNYSRHEPQEGLDTKTDGLTDRRTGLCRWTAQPHSASSMLLAIALQWSFIFLKAKLYNKLSGRFITVGRNFGCQFFTEAGAHKNFSFTWQYVKHAMQMPALIHDFKLPFCVRNKVCSFKSAHVALSRTDTSTLACTGVFNFISSTIPAR